eukprot:1723848-Pleurochrysis_carterae.AAC.4
MRRLRKTLAFFLLALYSRHALPPGPTSFGFNRYLESRTLRRDPKRYRQRPQLPSRSPSPQHVCMIPYPGLAFDPVGAQ